MALKKRKKVYLSFNQELLEFLDQESKSKSISRTRYINDILTKEFNKIKNRKFSGSKIQISWKCQASVRLIIKAERY